MSKICHSSSCKCFLLMSISTAIKFVLTNYLQRGWEHEFFLGMSNREETLRKTPNMPEWLMLSWFGNTLESFQKNWKIWLWKELLPPTTHFQKSKRHRTDGWTDWWMDIYIILYSNAKWKSESGVKFYKIVFAWTVIKYSRVSCFKIVPLQFGLD